MEPARRRRRHPRVLPLGHPACYGVKAVTTETADAVTVELQSGLLPEAADRMCTAKAVLGATDITLDAPVGDRRVFMAS